MLNIIVCNVIVSRTDWDMSLVYSRTDMIIISSRPNGDAQKRALSWKL